MQALLGMGGTAAGSLGTAFGMTPDMINALGGAGGDAASAMQSAMKGAQGNPAAAPGMNAHAKQIDISHILAVLQDQQKKALGT